jgi:hypothetical protein
MTLLNCADILRAARQKTTCHAQRLERTTRFEGGYLVRARFRQVVVPPGAGRGAEHARGLASEVYT